MRHMNLIIHEVFDMFDLRPSLIEEWSIAADWLEDNNEMLLSHMFRTGSYHKENIEEGLNNVLEVKQENKYENGHGFENGTRKGYGCENGRGDGYGYGYGDGFRNGGGDGYGFGYGFGYEEENE